jgi:26S proteasome regulatory subunit T5
MSTLEDLDDLEREGKDQKKDQDGDDKKVPGGDGLKDAEMKDADGKKEEEDVIDLEILHSSTVDIINRRRMLENELKIMKSEFQRLKHEETSMKDKIKDNTDKIENNRYVR